MQPALPGCHASLPAFAALPRVTACWCLPRATCATCSLVPATRHVCHVPAHAACDVCATCATCATWPQAEIDALQNRLNQLNIETSSEIAMLREHNHRMSDNCADLSKQLEETHKKLEAATAALEALTRENESLKEEAGKGVAQAELDALRAAHEKECEELRAAHDAELRAAALEAFEKQEELEKVNPPM